MKKNKINGAGLVAISHDHKKVLTLWSNGRFDLPKGAIEKNERPIDAAFREAEEEAGINRFDCELIVEKPGVFDNIQFYYVLWEGELKIVPNPKTGIVEHDDIRWMSWRKAIVKAPQFLKPALFHGLAITALLPRRKK